MKKNAIELTLEANKDKIEIYAIIIKHIKAFSEDGKFQICEEFVEDLTTEFSNRLEQLVVPKIAEREALIGLAEETYIKIAKNLIGMAGADKDHVEEILKIMDNQLDSEDLQMITVIETALWKAYNRNFSA